VSILADLEIALRQDCAYARLADSHVHRAIREDSLGLIKGRDAIMAAWLAEGRQSVTITADMGEMIAYRANDTWNGHRWVWREEGRIIREIVVEDRGAARIAPPTHAPLGELRAGRGQYAAGDQAVLPPDFPPQAKALADTLHQAWNGRAFDLHHSEWAAKLICDLPDATFQFEHAVVHDSKTALLWRLFGHTANGKRIRLIGSSVFSDASEQTIFDNEALVAQKNQEYLNYAAA
jgi:hypothetical protein